MSKNDSPKHTHVSFIRTVRDNGVQAVQFDEETEQPRHTGSHL